MALLTGFIEFLGLRDFILKGIDYSMHTILTYLPAIIKGNQFPQNNVTAHTVLTFGRDTFFSDPIIIAIVTTIAFVISMIALYVLVRLVTNAFRTKRALLLRTNSIFPFTDVYLGMAKELYENSIYKLEHDLFESLNRGRERPKEIPYDKIISGTVSLGIIVFFVTIAVAYYSSMIHGASLENLLTFTYVLTINQIQHIAIASSFIGFISLILIVIPFLQYRRRRLFQLL